MQMNMIQKGGMRYKKENVNMKNERKICVDCFWYEQCGDDTPCSFFDSIVDDNGESIIENNRLEFIDEYNEYIEERR